MPKTDLLQPISCIFLSYSTFPPLFQTSSCNCSLLSKAKSYPCKAKLKRRLNKTHLQFFAWAFCVPSTLLLRSHSQYMNSILFSGPQTGSLSWTFETFLFYSFPGTVIRQLPYRCDFSLESTMEQFPPRSSFSILPLQLHYDLLSYKAKRSSGSDEGLNLHPTKCSSSFLSKKLFGKRQKATS